MTPLLPRENSGACPTCGQPTLKVLTANWQMTRDEMEALRSAWEEAAKDPRMIVLNGGLKLEELTDEDLARVGLQRINASNSRGLDGAEEVQTLCRLGEELYEVASTMYAGSTRLAKAMAAWDEHMKDRFTRAIEETDRG